MSLKYEVTAIIGKYTDKNGDEKNRYLTIGAIINTRAGLLLKLDAIPTNWEGFAYLNEPKARDEQPARAAKQAPKAGFEDIADDIPF